MDDHEEDEETFERSTSRESDDVDADKVDEVTGVTDNKKFFSKYNPKHVSAAVQNYDRI